MEFEWDEAKRLRVLEARGIDFIKAYQIFDGQPLLTAVSPRDDEDRWLSVGRIDGELIAVVWTIRGERVRIITMRRARREEKRRYQALHRG